jgi:hypothetical protein
MSSAGWYPDPGGTPARLRFWSGAQWSQQTIADPRVTPAPTPDAEPPVPSTEPSPPDAEPPVLNAEPSPPDAEPSPLEAEQPDAAPPNNTDQPDDTDQPNDTVPPPAEVSRFVRLWSGLAILLVLALAVALLWIPGKHVPVGQPAVPAGEQATPDQCPVSSGTGTTAQVAGKQTAGTLQIDQINGWEQLPSDYFGFAYDGHWQGQDVTPDWISSIGVALLARGDGFTDPASAAGLVVACLASTTYYTDFLNRTDTSSAATTVDGHPAWRIRTQIRIADPSLPQIPGAVNDVTVVDLGGGIDHLGLAIGEYTIGDTATQQKIDDALATLSVIG